MGHSLEMYLYRLLLERESYLSSVDEWQAFESDVARVNKIFDPHFYRLGRHGQIKDGAFERQFIRLWGGTAIDFMYLSIYLNEQRWIEAIFKQGLTVSPTCMPLHCVLTEDYAREGRYEAAIDHLNSALSCYQHTRYCTNLAEFYDLGPRLWQQHPILVSDETSLTLRQGDDYQARAKRIVSLCQKGDVANGIKLLNDLSDTVANYQPPVILDFYRTHYQVLGWDWAVALGNLRRPEIDGENEPSQAMIDVLQNLSKPQSD